MDTVPNLGGHFQKGPRDGRPGVADDRIHAAHFLHGLFHHADALFHALEIGLEAVCFPARLFDLAERVLGALATRVITEADLGSIRRELDRNPLPDAGAAARDDDAFPR